MKIDDLILAGRFAVVEELPSSVEVQQFVDIHEASREYHRLSDLAARATIKPTLWLFDRHKHIVLTNEYS